MLSRSGDSLSPSKYDNEEQITGAADGGATPVMNPVWALGACEDQSQPKDVDFGIMSVDDCVGYFMFGVDSCE